MEGGREGILDQKEGYVPGRGGGANGTCLVVAGVLVTDEQNTEFVSSEP